jgi:hypothetical protein
MGLFALLRAVRVIPTTGRLNRRRSDPHPKGRTKDGTQTYHKDRGSGQPGEDQVNADWLGFLT